MAHTAGVGTVTSASVAGEGAAEVTAGVTAGVTTGVVVDAGARVTLGLAIVAGEGEVVSVGEEG